MFWQLTPWQFGCCIEAHITKTENAHDSDAWMMYHGAVLTRVKKVPPLKDFMAGAKKVSKKIDEADIMARLKAYQSKRGKLMSDNSSEAQR